MTGTRRARLGIVAAAAALLAFVGVGVVRADLSPSLPPVAPPRLLAGALEALARPFSISGTVETTIDLGLPDLPSATAAAGGPIGQLSGEQRFRVWRSPDGVRVAHLLDAREQVFVANRSEAWWWDSQTLTATPLPLRGRPADGATPERAPSPGELLELSSAILRHAQRHATVSVETTARVAGRPVYELALVPRSELTRIGRITLAIDHETRLPLRYRVFPRGSDTAAIEAAFTQVSFDPINARTFAFSPPPGAVVGDAHMPYDAHGVPSDDAHGPGAGASGWRAFGAGFDLRFAVRLEAPLPGDVDALLPYAGPLASAIAVPRADGTWLLAGFVDVSTLERDAATLP